MASTRIRAGRLGSASTTSSGWRFCAGLRGPSTGAQFGTYSQIQTRAVVNVPLVEEHLFSRVSFFRETRDGYQKNNYTSVRSRDAQDADDTSVRAQLRFVPSEDVDFILRGTYTHLGGNGSGAKLIGDFPEEADTGPFGVQDIYRVCGKTSFSPCNNENPSDPRRVYLNDFPDQDLDSYAASGTLTWDLFDLPWLGDAQLTAIGSWQRADGSFFLDADYSESFLVNAFTDFPKTRQYTAELRLASASEGPLEWLGGFYYLNETDQTNIDARSGLADLLLPGPTIEISAIQDSTLDTQSYAVFGNASYRLGEDTETVWDDLRLIGGLRYTYDKKEATRDAPLARLFVPDDPSFPGQEICTALDEVCPVDVEDSDSWGELSGEAGIEWAWSLDSMAYLKVARGYKAGTIELGPPPNTPPGPLIGDDVTADNPDPEKLWAYEIGSKNRFLEERLQANFTAFYYDYDDLQITQLIDDQEITENAAKATVWGAEAEFVALPMEGLLLTANFSYLSAELDEFISNDAANPVSLDPTEPNYDPSAFDCGRRDPCLDFGGNTMIRAPEYSMTLAAQYTLELGRWGTLTPRAQFYASDDVWYRPYNEPSTDKTGNYTKTDVRLTWVSEEGHFSVEGFVDNLFDEDVPQSVFVGSSLLGFPVQGVYDPPRTTGVRIGFRW
jgi:iron complex outermembrane receptor protein